jgi:hypothetical protein
MMPLEECVKEHPDQSDCFDTSNLDKYIIPPLYIIESLYDEFALKYNYGVKCIHLNPQHVFYFENCTAAEQTLIEKYRAKGVEVLKSYASNVKNGVWGISCVIHTFTESDTLYTFNSDNWKAPIKNLSVKAKNAL